MQFQKAGVFTLDYMPRTVASPDTDIQFGMDFTLRQDTQGKTLALSQLIFPATAVGTNRTGQWNIDNHAAPGKDPACLVFGNAGSGVITDRPTEISRRNLGVLTTRFVVFRVDVANGTVQTSGVSFGYRIDTGAAEPRTEVIDLQRCVLTPEQRKVIQAQCSTVRFT